MTALALPGRRSAWHVATLGFFAAAEHPDAELGAALKDGIGWLRGRRWNRPYLPPTLEADGVAMLGVALGVVASRPGDARELAGLASEGCGSSTLTAFTRSLMAVAAYLMGAPPSQDLSVILPEVRVALCHLGVLPGDHGCGPEAWRAVTSAVRFGGSASHAAMALRAFDSICEVNLPARLGRLESADVVRVLQGLSRAMRFWTWEDKARTKTSPQVRWDIENEYHVQNLLWTVMAPLFPDLLSEEHTSSVGQKSPRLDLGIPSLRLVVEVKFVRVGTRFADVIEEIAADSALYSVDSRWKALVPFVWDDSGRTEEHATLVDGLRRLDMVHDAIVVPRPGKMVRPNRVAKASTRRGAT